MKKISHTAFSRVSARRSSMVLASAFGLSLIFSLSSQNVAAGTNPPFNNPPTGNVTPTFTSMETMGDMIVGQTLRVGNYIAPKTGDTLNLQADLVHTAKDFSTGGDVTIPTGSSYRSDGPTLDILPGEFTLGNGSKMPGFINMKGGTYFTNGNENIAHIGPTNSTFNTSIWIGDNDQQPSSLAVNGNITSGGKITASAIGKYFFVHGPLANNNGDSSTATCPTNVVMIGCMRKDIFGTNVYSYQTNIIPNAVGALLTPYNGICMGTNLPKSSSAAAYCFDPSTN